jgi:hypothetical protein
MAGACDRLGRRCVSAIVKLDSPPGVFAAPLRIDRSVRQDALSDSRT